MTPEQKEKLTSAMAAYQEYLNTGISRFTQRDIDAIWEVKNELKIKGSFCRGCLDEIVKYAGQLYEHFQA